MLCVYVHRYRLNNISGLERPEILKRVPLLPRLSLKLSIRDTTFLVFVNTRQTLSLPHTYPCSRSAGLTYFNPIWSELGLGEASG